MLDAIAPAYANARPMPLAGKRGPKPGQRPETEARLRLLETEEYQAMSAAAVAQLWGVTKRYVEVLRSKLHDAGRLNKGGSPARVPATEPPRKLSYGALFKAMKVAMAINLRLAHLPVLQKWLWEGIVEAIWQYGDGLSVAYTAMNMPNGAALAAHFTAQETDLAALFRLGLLIEVDGGLAVPEDLGVTGRRRRRRPPRVLAALPLPGRDIPELARLQGASASIRAGDKASGGVGATALLGWNSGGVPVAMNAGRGRETRTRNANRISPENGGFPSAVRIEFPLMRIAFPASCAGTLPLSSTSPKYSLPLENTGFLKRESAREAAPGEGNCVRKLGNCVRTSHVFANVETQSPLPALEGCETDLPAPPLQPSETGQPAPGEVASTPAPVPAAPEPGKALGKEEVRQTPLPDDWQPNEEGRQDVQKWMRNPDLVTEKFIAHFQANGERLANWDARFKKWVRQEAEYNPGAARPEVSQTGAAQSQAGAEVSQAATEPDPAGLQGDAKTWAQARATLKSQLSPGEFTSWIGKLKLGERGGDGSVTLWTEAKFLADSIRASFGDRIQRAWAFHDRGARVEIRHRAPA